MSLTRRQAELLTFIHTSTQASGVSPSYAEMAAAVRLKSKAGIHRMMKALTERGYIRRLYGHARAVEVLRLPYGAVSPGALAAENATMRLALLWARDALDGYDDPVHAHALTAVLGALRGTARRD